MKGIATEEGYQERIAILAEMDAPEDKIGCLIEWIKYRIEAHEVLGADTGDACDYQYLRLCRHVLGELQDGFETLDFLNMRDVEPEEEEE